MDPHPVQKIRLTEMDFARVRVENVEYEMIESSMTLQMQKIDCECGVGPTRI